MLTREELLGIDDSQVKEIHVPVWDVDIFIRKLTRGQQDQYSRRRFGNPKMIQTINKKAKDIGSQEVESNVDIFGHDSWLVAQGVCDENGKRIFKNTDIPKLDNKDGEAIGFIAKEIILFSAMSEDVEELEDIKN